MLLQLSPATTAEAVAAARDAHQHAQEAAASGGPLGSLLYFAVIAIVALLLLLVVAMGYKFIWKTPGASQQEVNELRKDVAAVSERLVLFKLNTDKDFAATASVTERLLNTANSMVILTERSAEQTREIDVNRAEISRIKDQITDIRIDVSKLAARHKSDRDD